ncbi:MAG: penicillin-binding protein 1C, partial [Spirochaetales bacterium]|nr:penicillin-binding protein 1C [Spirochaetales bacterium]
MKDRLLRYNLIFIFPYFLGVAAITLLSLFPLHVLEVFADRPVSTELTDRHGKILRVLVLEDGTRRQYVPLKSISDETRHIFLMSEDRRFYLHPGVDPLSLARGVVQLLTGQSSVSGGSTISMQLARMMRFSHTKYPIWRRKLGEMVTAIRIEQKISKNRILELWLNNLPFGSQVEGIGSAARMFYN